MRVESVDWYIAIPLGAILFIAWLILVYRQNIQQYVDNFFAMRRHVRREKARQQREHKAFLEYNKRDIAAVKDMYTTQRRRHVALRR